jgi:hypothetical protein
MATARLGHADLSLRDHNVAWRAIEVIGQSPLPGNRVSLSPDQKNGATERWEESYF